MYRRSRRLCGQGRRRHEEGVVDIRESPLTEARRGAEPEKARAQGRRPEPARARGRRPERARRRGRVASGKVSAPLVLPGHDRPFGLVPLTGRGFELRGRRRRASKATDGIGRSLTCKNNHTGVRTCYVVPEPGDTRVGAVYPCHSLAQLPAVYHDAWAWHQYQ